MAMPALGPSRTAVTSDRSLRSYIHSDTTLRSDRHAAAVVQTLVTSLGVVWFVASVIAVWPYTPDDAFISLRYARNFAAGNGLTFNVVGPPAEGYTSFLWVLLLAIPHRIGIDALSFAKLSSTLAMFGCILATGSWARSIGRLQGRSELGLIGVGAAVLLATLPATAAHAVSAMDTSLFAFLLTLFSWQLFVALATHDRSRMRWCAVLALTVGLTRPEGNLAVVTSLVVAVVMCSPEDRKALLKSSGALYVVPGAAYMLWRCTFYGTLFPLPFYVKVAGHGSLAGLPTAKEFLTYVGLHFVVLLPLMVTRTPRALLPSCAATLALFVFFLFPQPVMGYEWRFLFPLLPLVCAWAGSGTVRVLPWLESKGIGPLRYALVAAILVSTVLNLIPDARESRDDLRAYAAGLTRAHVALGQELQRSTTQPKSPVLAIGDAGAVPYYSGWYTIDTHGLNNPVIARAKSYDAGYVLQQRPDVLVLLSSSATTFVSKLDYEKDLYDAALHAGMGRSDVLQFAPGYYLWVFESSQPTAREQAEAPPS
ncbi:MAG: hypothetical protein HY270_13385 [Deltaproteobacteria bacterium]|nr:hypothetical protein [Deltaproteobacteria bacterium]